MSNDLQKQLGEILGRQIQDSIESIRMSQRDLASQMGMPQPRLNELLKGRRKLTAKDAIKVGFFLGCDPMLLLRLQAQVDLEMAKKNPRLEHWALNSPNDNVNW